MLQARFNQGDIVRLIETGGEHEVLSCALTTRHIDDDTAKEEYIVEEVYMLTDTGDWTDVSKIEFVRHAPEPEPEPDPSPDILSEIEKILSGGADDELFD